MFRRLALSAAAAFAAAGCVALFAWPGRALSNGASNEQLAEILVGVETLRVVSVVNRHDDVFVTTSIQTSCVCTAVGDSPSPIPPGGRVAVPVRLKAGPKQARTSATLTLIDEAGTNTIQARVSAATRAPFAGWPEKAEARIVGEVLEVFIAPEYRGLVRCFDAFDRHDHRRTAVLDEEAGVVRVALATDEREHPPELELVLGIGPDVEEPNWSGPLTLPSGDRPARQGG